ncbi:MAG: hypothetical protein F6K62_10180 [Sphaerospermopsis sp. SIO1G2]|nr:hypothetical protein [Sphaerospermopsis sp. SIO1G2]
MTTAVNDITDLGKAKERLDEIQAQNPQMENPWFAGLRGAAVNYAIVAAAAAIVPHVGRMFLENASPELSRIGRIVTGLAIAGAVVSGGFSGFNGANKKNEAFNEMGEAARDMIGTAGDIAMKNYGLQQEKAQLLDVVSFQQAALEQQQSHRPIATAGTATERVSMARETALANSEPHL